MDTGIGLDQVKTLERSFAQYSRKAKDALAEENRRVEDQLSKAEQAASERGWLDEHDLPASPAKTALAPNAR